MDQFTPRSFLVRFQFLIGTLKTDILAIYCPSYVLVSIPDRYAKNFAMQIFIPRFNGVSIPDRYAKNGAIYSSPNIGMGVSIPDRYAKNP